MHKTSRHKFLKLCTMVSNIKVGQLVNHDILDATGRNASQRRIEDNGAFRTITAPPTGFHTLQTP